jgi:multisubunit Na+/H+ antiporter MnhB subunit
MFAFSIHIDALDPAKRPLMFLFVGLLVAFILIRVNTRLIRSGVTWWFGDFRPSGLHIHHSVFGILIMAVAGILQFAWQPTGWWLNLTAFFFGGGLALTLDEFALILHVEDVYWAEQGRQSIDAVILGIAFVALLLTGLVPLTVPDTTSYEVASRWIAVALIGANVVFVVITFLKGKLWLGTLGLFVPFLAVVPALRLAKPSSPWAHTYYADRPAKLVRARRRDEGWHQRWARRKHRLWDLIGGRPHLPHLHEQGVSGTPLLAEEPAARLWGDHTAAPITEGDVAPRRPGATHQRHERRAS